MCGRASAGTTAHATYTHTHTHARPHRQLIEGTSVARAGVCVYSFMFQTRRHTRTHIQDINLHSCARVCLCVCVCVHGHKHPRRLRVACHAMPCVRQRIGKQLTSYNTTATACDRFMEPCMGPVGMEHAKLHSLHCAVTHATQNTHEASACLRCNIALLHLFRPCVFCKLKSLSVACKDIDDSCVYPCLRCPVPQPCHACVSAVHACIHKSYTCMGTRTSATVCSCVSMVCPCVFILSSCVCVCVCVCVRPPELVLGQTTLLSTKHNSCHWPVDCIQTLYCLTA